MTKKKKAKATYTGYFKFLGEEVRVDATHTDTPERCKTLIKEYKSDLKKRGIVAPPRLKVKKLRVY